MSFMGNLGEWVILQNCHLAEAWMSRLAKLWEEDILACETNPGRLKRVHRAFRLWLTSYSTSTFPSSLLQTGVKVNFN